MKNKAKARLILAIASCAVALSTYVQAGDLLYAKGFTQSQRVQVKDCYKKDSSFLNQVRKLTSEGDIVIKGMQKQRNGYQFMTMKNTRGKWMKYTPLHCDLRTEEKKKSDLILKQNQEKKRAKKIQDEQLIKQETAKKKALETKTIVDSKAQKEKDYRKEQELKAKRVAYRKANVRKQALRCKDELLAEINIPNDPSYKTAGSMKISNNHIKVTVEVAKHRDGLKRSVKNYFKKCNVKPTVFPRNL
ncbi:hypothetical protein HWV00_05845 [Moritella sp. 24]|uniref:hypothetical protein n=1 Tax=Moritella sp. 24 TaxID=2746230 RepID=UPI001BAC0967|nr:hypothetical protein [Moritella sp. 24]QUM75790.1 hypothetical protein HWV00_05845 [Moritella sp. 24]